jgi:hypothetical protein
MASPRQQQFGGFRGPQAYVVVYSNIFPDIADALPDATLELARKYIDKVYEHSQERVPVDTGALKESGHVFEEPDAVVLSYNAPNNIGISYAAYVEYGTHSTRAQPYVNPAVESAMSVFNEGLEDALSGLI